jgi:hypothetical protein
MSKRRARLIGRDGAKALASALTLLVPGTGAADARFEILTEGEGFDDATPRERVGGNELRTLGAQRLAAVGFAAEQWGALLDSPVPVAVQVRFADLGCAPDAVVLAHAGAVKMVRAIPREGVDPMLWFPSALANRLAGVDLSPGEPDVQMEINSAVDSACKSSAGGWYYGFDGARDGSVDLVETVMHELAHGLGFSSSVDPETGVSGLPAGIDVFSAHIRDLRSGMPWISLSVADRKFATRSPRSLVFEGAHTEKRARALLSNGADAMGRPFLYTTVPVDRGSAVSHFDPLARPDLLMEPFSRRVPTHDVDLTLSVLADLGWVRACAGCGMAPTVVTRCGDGMRDPGEACDDGEGNSDSAPNACRASCRAPACGDGVVDRGEDCDRSEGCSDRCTDDGAGATAAVKPPMASAPSLKRERGGCALGQGDTAGWMLGLLGFALVGRRRISARSRRAAPASLRA